MHNEEGRGVNGWMEQSESIREGGHLVDKLRQPSCLLWVLPDRLERSAGLTYFRVSCLEPGDFVCVTMGISYTVRTDFGIHREIPTADFSSISVSVQQIYGYPPLPMNKPSRKSKTFKFEQWFR